MTKPAEPGNVTLTGLIAGARVVSPLTIEGAADTGFFFEGVFPVELVANGEVIEQAPAEPQEGSDWTASGPVKFRAELTFAVTKETNAELVLSEDMPQPVSDDSDERGPARAVRIPVVLVPPR